MGRKPKQILSQNGHAVRSSDTRARMIEAAIQVFGAVGFEAASTRKLAEHAGVSLAAIPYHFGGKRELYSAAAEAIADYGGTLVDDITERLHQDTTQSTLARIENAASAFLRALIAGAEPQAWVDFFARSANEDPDAHNLIYRATFGRFESVLKVAISEYVGCSPDDDVLRLRVAVVMASVLAFRTHRAALLGRLGWSRLDKARLGQLDATIRSLVRSEFLLDAPYTMKATHNE